MWRFLMRPMLIFSALISCAILSACGEDDSPPAEESGVIERDAFPDVHAGGTKCDGASDYLAQLENENVGLVIGTVDSVRPLLDVISWGDSEESVTLEECGGDVYPAIAVSLSSTRSNIDELSGSAVEVHFGSEYVESWEPSPLVHADGSEVWRTRDGDEGALEFTSDVRIAVIVAADEQGRLIAYEGWLGEVDEDGAFRVSGTDGCQELGDEQTEDELWASVDADYGARETIGEPRILSDVLVSFCGAN